ncbi:HpcH/HpaI aldolase family protein [Pseudonocardia endophytica]|uniref:4-hydroxy-2-oxoheptanedioate aldolase n=1 Tax=Pseudonocardia endophytica TaxID=401976 RepID=A0A4R1HQG1_PSEEN|nr:aldolase/citrate lyase family protein [Pseudonocardia endophytica]TCK22965.1 4-hydroxy-2-oxoheptanedioate aldolase [Pseudonocardia endophytica]
MDELRFDSDLVGGWLQLPSPATAEVVGSVGFDMVVIDAQHGLIGEDALLGMLQALSATGTRALVRVPGHGDEPVAAALDRGADGVIVPLVNSAAEASAAVAACHYPPRGRRSYGPTRLGWHGRDTAAPGRCVVMVETREAVEALEEILVVDGLDAIFVGPSDLALAHGMELAAQHGDPEYDALLSRITDACRAAGVPAGIWCAGPENLHRYRSLGFTFFGLSAEHALLRAAATEALARSRPGGLG